MLGLLKLLGWLSTPCREMSTLISRAMDEKLPWWERAAVRIHVVYCRSCHRLKHQLEALRDALRETERRWAESDGANGPRLSDEARDRIRSNLPDQPR